MTKKEAVGWLENIKEKYIHGGDEDFDKKRKCAIDMAIEALEQQPSYVTEIEEEYKKAVKNTWIRKPLAKALYEVWKKHDREDAERRRG